jgi:hypothetical protein
MCGGGFEGILGYSGISHAHGTYNSRRSSWHARSSTVGWRRVSDLWNIAGSTALSASRTPCARRQEADAHPCNRRRNARCRLRIGHGSVLPELDSGAARGGPVFSRGELRSRRTRLERSGARATHCAADCAGLACAAECSRRTRAIRSRGAFLRRLRELGLRESVS